MSLVKPPFQPERLEEEKADDKSYVMTVRINETERVILMGLRKVLNIENDSKALKKGAEIGLNVLLAVFGEKLLKFVTDGKRVRLSDFERGVNDKI